MLKKTPTKISSSTTLFNIDNTQCFLKHQISILEGFLKDHVTPNMGIIVVKNSALPSQEYITLKKKKISVLLHLSSAFSILTV